MEKQMREDTVFSRVLNLKLEECPILFTRIPYKLPPPLMQILGTVLNICGWGIFIVRPEH